MLDRKVFFDNVRSALFQGGIAQPQVDGITADLNYWEANYPDGNPQHLAYILATEYWETQQTMQPIPENGGKDYLTRMYDIRGSRPAKARELGNINPGDGALYTGGKVQLTGRANFRKMGKKLGIDLEGHPELVYQMSTSTAILFAGMMDGDFTGKSLADFTDLSGNLDPTRARKVVNGTDHATEIATIFALFWDAIQAAALATEQPVPIADVPTVPTVTAKLPDDYLDYRMWKQEQQRKAASKLPIQSKILVTAVAGLLSMLLARYGIELTPDQLINAITAIGSTSLTLIGIFRLFFTNKPLRN